MQIAFLFYDGMTALDAIGPHEILCRVPGAKVQRVAKKAGAVRTDSAGLELIADYALADVSYVDILVIPGAGSATTLRDSPEILAWIRSIHATTQWTTSVCTGSLILGAAGLLSGLRATTHWAVMDRLSAWDVEPVSERIVESGKIITAAGVSAGIDMALILAAKIAGPQVAQTLQLGIEYDPEPPFDTGSAKKANPKIRDALLARMSAQFENIK
ncbi:MAG: DJ-1/PfpI family protein [Verrucomicrobia bacterium]|nr:DJ-1/PfpI family protein [Verrucomicrobiota bacterium]